jgi:hypothetical protein
MPPELASEPPQSTTADRPATDRPLPDMGLPTSGPEADSTSVAAAPPSQEPTPAEVTVQDLARALAKAEPEAALADSRDALMQAWQLEPRGQETISFEDLQKDLLDTGFSVLALQGTSLARLEELDRPALLELVDDEGIARLVLLDEVREVPVNYLSPRTPLPPDAPSQRWVVLRGLGDAPLSTSPDELLERWSQRAWVVWREPAPLPRFLAPGSTGEAVSWLQESLQSVGAFDGEPTGEYDLPTTLAVRAFQESAAIPVDGTVGPLTKLRLYERMSDVDPQPRLVTREGAS